MAEIVAAVGVPHTPAFPGPVAASAAGTNDGTPGMNNRTVPLAAGLGAEVLAGLTEKGYYPSRNAKLTMDHSVMVPFGVGGVTIEHYVRGIKAHLTSPGAGG